MIRICQWFICFIVVFFTSSIFLINTVSAIEIVNGNPAIKIIVFNTGDSASNNIYNTDPLSRWLVLANYTKAQQVDVVLLQEVNSPQLPIIQQAFDLVGYPMYMTSLDPNSSQAISVESNPIFSKYPFILNTNQVWQIRHNRYILSTVIKTPYGDLRVVNLHTHHENPCQNTVDTIKPILTTTSPYYQNINQEIIIAGDYNIVLSEIRENRDTKVLNCRDGAYFNPLNDLLKGIKAFCTLGSPCINLGNIDMIWSVKGGPTQIYSNWHAPSNIKEIGDSHPVVVGLVGSTNWRINYNDLNNDGVVSIIDVLELLKKLFNSNYTLANVHATGDFNNNGVVDLMDVILLIQNIVK